LHLQPTSRLRPTGAQFGTNVIYDWYTCASWDGRATWSCVYDGSDGFDYYWVDIPTHIAVLSKQDCGVDPTGCPEGGAGFVAMAPVEEYDAVLPTGALPNCSGTLTRESEKKWCAGSAPSGSRRTRIQTALSRMHAIGGICDTLAKIGDSLLVHGTLKMYKPAAADSGGAWAPAGGGDHGPNSWMALSQVWTDVYFDSTRHTMESVHRNLQQTLAHELDHLNGVATHFGSPYSTLHSESCSLVP